MVNTLINLSEFVKIITENNFLIARELYTKYCHYYYEKSVFRDDYPMPFETYLIKIIINFNSLIILKPEIYMFTVCNADNIPIDNSESNELGYKENLKRVLFKNTANWFFSKSFFDNESFADVINSKYYDISLELSNNTLETIYMFN